ncbi:DNA polymerase III subunit beta [Frankia sp. CNm7]|uniref:DNA polymerase III subunit beta n=1 Tax=Frankia nepalensis TaxID=1836974 RepID=A0A937RSM4_9ACTN|nr:DNA polymerase III subunit beta [Frankia nepalensis]MBL7501031.1 DNA polymerase III subunit beta [Frankia nepalensis]MBL7514260.1 DNA polymerase III subunit beta [Frankia nepalensis]MBL7518819.1 DNA polymerase III subunit beta [Frankia nepalensis]MBL7632003.1 DNA polymerase III subunit beta [Frankia nepalensis]
MRVTVPRAEFAEAASWVARHLPARAMPAPLAASAGMVLDAGERLTLSAFDHQVAVTATLDTAAAVPGRALVPGRLVAEIVRSLHDESVRLVVDEGWLLVRAAGAHYRVPTLPLVDYPALPEFPPPVGEVDTLGFAAAVNQVVPAAARDETFPVLTALRLELGARGLTLVATDRYRLAVRTIPWRPSVRAPEAVAHVPARLLADLARIPTAASRLALGLGTEDEGGPARFGLSTGSRRVVVRLVNGTFPHYRRLFPDSVPLLACAHIGPLVAAIRRVAVVAPRTGPVVRLTLSAGMLTADVGPDAGTTTAADSGPLGLASATDSVPIDYDGPDLVAWYNPGYLLDGLGAVDGDEVTIGFADTDPEEAARLPAILTGKDDDGYRYVLMPVVRSGGA